MDPKVAAGPLKGGPMGGFVQSIKELIGHLVGHFMVQNGSKGGPGAGHGKAAIQGDLPPAGVPGAHLPAALIQAEKRFSQPGPVPGRKLPQRHFPLKGKTVQDPLFKFQGAFRIDRHGKVPIRKVRPWQFFPLDLEFWMA
jgi:hypothetical protein